MRKTILILMLLVCPVALFSQSQVRTEASNNKPEYFALAGTDTISSVRGVATSDEVRYIERLIFSEPVASDTTIIVTSLDTTISGSDTTVVGGDTLVSVIQTSDVKPHVVEIGAIVRTDYTLCIRKKASKVTVVWRERY